MPNHEAVEPERLIDAIGRIFAKGLTLSAEARHYIDSTFLHPSPDELAKMLSGEADSETETLLELIFFPGEDIQIELEPLLEAARFERGDEGRVVSALVARTLETEVLIPGRRSALPLGIPAAIAARFVARLNIARHLDSRLREALERHVAPEQQARFKVRFRNARAALDEDRIAFLGRFFERLGAESDTALPGLDFLLALFGEGPSGGDIYRDLMEKKRFYLHNLKKALDAHRQLEKSNMETLMLQGTRFAYIDPADARDKIRRIDRIAWAVFGRSDPCGQEADGVDLGEFSRREGLDAMFQLLS